MRVSRVVRPEDPPPRRRRRGFATIGVALFALGIVGVGTMLYFPAWLPRAIHLPSDVRSLARLPMGNSPARKPLPAPPSPSLQTPATQLTSFGATEQAWSQAHQRVSGTNDYDPDETLPAVDVHRSRYFAVETVNDRVVGFSMTFHAGTPIEQAKSELLLAFPPDTQIAWLKETASCAQMEVKSPTVGQALGTLDLEGWAYIHFVTAKSDFTWGYDPTSVTVAQVERNAYRTPIEAPPC